MNLTFFYGDNQQSLKKEVQVWKQSFLSKYPNTTNFVEYKNPSQEIESILNEIYTPPFLDPKKLIFVYNLAGALEEKTQSKFFKQIANLPESTILVVIQEIKIAKNAKILSEFKKIAQVKEFTSTPADLFKSAQSLLQKLQKNIDPNLLKDLIFKLENNPQKIENELIKLSLFADTDQISENDIKQIVSFSTNISVFELIDNLSAKDTKKAFFNFHNMTQSGEEPTKIFYLIARQLRILIQLISLKNQKLSETEIAKASGLHPFVVKKTLPKITKFNLNQLKLTLQKILDFDTDLKTGNLKYTKNDQTELLLRIELIILDLCH